MDKKVAIITGGSRGVGADLAKLCAEKGWNMTITCSNSIDDAKNVAKECEKLGSEVLVLQADVSSDKDCEETVSKTIKKWGRLDSLVNNAGKTKFNAHHNLEGLSSEDFIDLYSTNTVGPYQMIKYAKDHLMKAESPSVVNIASIAGVMGIGSSVAYAASKGALINMTKSLARALGPIRINAICPGFIQGDWLRGGLGDEAYELTKKSIEDKAPLSLTCTPRQVAETTFHFMTESVTVTGETLILDGGMHLGR